MVVLCVAAELELELTSKKSLRSNGRAKPKRGRGASTLSQNLALQSNFTVRYPVRKTIPRDIMGEAPRARITAQNTLTTWQADRLYGTILIASNNQLTQQTVHLK